MKFKFNEVDLTYQGNVTFSGSAFVGKFLLCVWYFFGIRRWVDCLCSWIKRVEILALSSSVFEGKPGKYDKAAMENRGFQSLDSFIKWRDATMTSEILKKNVNSYSIVVVVHTIGENQSLWKCIRDEYRIRF